MLQTSSPDTIVYSTSNFLKGGIGLVVRPLDVPLQFENGYKTAYTHFTTQLNGAQQLVEIATNAITRGPQFIERSGFQFLEMMVKIPDGFKQVLEDFETLVRESTGEEFNLSEEDFRSIQFRSSLWGDERDMLTVQVPRIQHFCTFQVDGQEMGLEKFMRWCEDYGKWFKVQLVLRASARISRTGFSGVVWETKMVMAKPRREEEVAGLEESNEGLRNLRLQALEGLED